MRRLASLFTLLPLILAVPAGAGPQSFTETFDTTTFRDPVRTTANWDTAAGEVTLLPFTPSVVGSLAATNSTRSVALFGNRAYVAEGADGLRVLDITDVTSPVQIGSLGFSGTTNHVLGAGNLVYVSNSSNFYVVDVTDPGAPTQIGSVTTSGASRMARRGTTFFVGSNSGVYVIDADSASAPVLVATIPTAAVVNDVALSGTTLFAAVGSGGVRAFDVSDPAGAVLLDTQAVTSAQGLSLYGNTLFVTAFTNLKALDVSDPSAMSEIGSVGSSPGSAGKVVAGKDRAYVTWGGHVREFDVSDPTSMSFLRQIDTPGPATSVSLTPDYLFIADATGGMRIVSWTDRLTSSSFQSLGPTAYPRFIQDDLLFASVGFTFEIHDLADPLVPVLLGTIPSYSGQITASGGRAYIGQPNINEDLGIVDISDPTNPTLIDSLETGFSPGALFLEGDRLYTKYLSVLHAFSTAGDSLVALGSYDNVENINGLQVNGNRAYVSYSQGFGQNYVRILDLSDPASISVVATQGVSFVSTLTLDGTVLYARSSEELRIYDISQDTFTYLGQFESPLPGNFTPHGDRLLCSVTSGTRRVFVLNVADPTQPFVEFDILGSASSGVLPGGGSFAYLAIGNMLNAVRLTTGDFDLAANQAQSSILPLVDPADIRLVRLVDDSDPVVIWEMSSDSAFSFGTTIPADGNWTGVFLGSTPYWRATLNPVLAGVSAVARSAYFEFLSLDPRIGGITDVPGDQGGYVRVEIVRSSDDFANDPQQTASYAVWRRVDNPAMVAGVQTAGAIVTDPDLGNLPMVEVDGQRYLARGRSPEGILGAAALATFPPGTWEWVASLPALQQDSYTVLVPTVLDSSISGSNDVVFVTSAHTADPDTWYVSDPDSGHSVDNLPPSAPQSLVLDLGILSWDAAPENDFAAYSVYGSATGTLDGTATILGQPGSPSFDVGDLPFDYYHVTVTDDADNEGPEATVEGSVTGVRDPGIAPTSTRLLAGRPNPFRAATTIAFDLARDGRAEITVFDVRGRRVRALLPGTWLPAGSRESRWDGRDDRGRRLPAGIYLVRMVTRGHSQSQRVTLLP